MTKTKKVTKATISRQQQIRQEVYAIIQKEAYDAFTTVNNRNDSISKRLSALEQTGLPNAALEQITTAISQIRYKQHQQQRAMEGLLDFFKITKNFFEEKTT